MDIDEKQTGWRENALACEDSLTAEEYRAMVTEFAPTRTPSMLYSIGFEADELLAVYAGMRAYLKALAATDSDENLGMILRVTQILLDLNPQAVKASKSLSLKAAGTAEPN